MVSTPAQGIKVFLGILNGIPVLRTTMIGEITQAMAGSEVTIAGWVHEVRELGKLTFMLVRDRTGIVQVVAKSGATEPAVKAAMSLPKESVVKVTGTVKLSKEARSGYEIVPKEVVDLNPLSAIIPFEVTGKVPAELDVRLDHRYIDMRRLETTAVFNIESTILRSFREVLTGLGFMEIRTPSIVKEATEGGTELFGVDYFESKAYLAQSPQLYKQMAVIGGLDRVFIITPVFRAEKSNTTYHLTESTQMDIEIGFANADDAIDILKKVVTGILKGVKERNAADLEILGVKGFDVPEITEVTYNELIDRIRADGTEIKSGDDISRKEEDMVRRLYGDAVVVRKFPASLRAFYSMPSPDNAELTESYDFIYKGLEICSGAQRIHKPEMLVESLERKGLDPEDFKSYVDAFRCGAPPHAGWSIGLERLAMRITGVSNIRECSLFPRDRKRLTP